MWQDWERSDWLFVAACIVSVTWILLSVMGLHPDGAILGFAGTMWMVWATSLKEADHRELRHRRDDDDEDDHDELARRRRRRSGHDTGDDHHEGP